MCVFACVCVHLSCLLNYLISGVCLPSVSGDKTKTNGRIHAKRQKQTVPGFFFSVPQVLRPGSRYEVSVRGVRKGNESGSISTEFTTGEV